MRAKNEKTISDHKNGVRDLPRHFKFAVSKIKRLTLLASCATSIKPLPAQISPLVIANCPLLAPLSDDSFGATVLKLIEVGNQYRDCRNAALTR